MRILIIHDKCSAKPTLDELDTLIQARQVRKALLRLGHEVRTTYFSLNLKSVERRIKKLEPELVFNLVETLEGSSLLHLCPELLEKLRIRYTGASARSMLLSSDKLLAKRLMKISGLPTPYWFDGKDTSQLDGLEGKKVILKPVAQEASVSIDDASVRSFGTKEALVAAFEASSTPLFAEQYIEGREFNVSILPTGLVLPPAEMLFLDYPKEKPRIVGYAAKWETDSFAYKHTQRSFSINQTEPDLASRLQVLTSETYQVFGGTGYARVDFRLDGEGNLWILEINHNPCLEEESGFVSACRQAGLDFDRVIKTIIEE